MAFTHRFPVRFEDVDYARIVYYPRLFQYCHWSFEAFFPQEAGLTYAQLLEKRKIGFPTVHARADFLSPLRFGDECRAVLQTARLGAKSVTNAYQLFAGESKTASAELEIVTVAVNMDSFQAIDIPEDLRAAFLKHPVKDR
ncbi:MAG TPA: thioesterase family protein [Myxococcales bacterium]|nr:thioesterase family protein [Myxococcales bacterium]